MPQELDAVRYEIFRHRLFNILEEGRIAIKMVSGSPVVVEGGETMCCLCDQNGNSILIAAGILLHAFGASDFVRKAIEWYSEDPGFADGDQLFFNDPYIGGQHLADQVIIKPVFHQKKLIAWVGSIMHTPETGGIEPGSSPTRATEIFQEGFRIQGLKIVEAGKFRKDVYNSLLSQARDPHLLALDTKAKIAANNTCARGYLQIIQRFGLDFVQAASQRMIQDSENMARAKLRNLPNGVWRSRLYGDVTGASQSQPYRVVCTMTKEKDNLTFDFTGSSPQNPGSVNLTLPATWGQLFVTLTSQLFWDVPWNAGMIAPVKLIASEGTVVNCRFPQACSNGVKTVGCLVREGVAHECIAKMLYAGGIHEDVTSGWKGAASGGPGFGGRNQYGDICGGIILDAFAGGVGATPFRDGVDTGGNMINPQSAVSDAEIIELNVPFMYLQRSNATDSGGFGKFAGGMAPQAIYMVYGTKNFKVTLHRPSRKTTGNFGMFGGYPSAFLDGLMVVNSHLPEWFHRSQVPAGFADIELLGGEIVNPQGAENIPMRSVEQYDLMFVRMGAGGGYGDPLERDPNLVLADIQRLAISTDTASKVYGVIVDLKTMKLDLAATQKKRQSIIQERLKQGKRSHPQTEKALPTGKGRTLLRMHEYLEIASVDGSKVVRCVKCGHVFCQAEENYKRYALLRERDPSEIPLRSLTSKEPLWVLFQEYICPGCGTLLEVDLVCPQLDSPEEWILWDIQLKLPSPVQL